MSIINGSNSLTHIFMYRRPTELFLKSFFFFSKSFIEVLVSKLGVKIVPGSLYFYAVQLLYFFSSVIIRYDRFSVVEVRSADVMFWCLVALCSIEASLILLGTFT